MALARKCDRCGKFFESKCDTWIDLKTSSDADRSITFDFGCCDLDLCGDCIGSFKRWWTDKFETTYPVTKYYITGRFKIELSDAVYLKGEPACVISKNLGLPGDCITKIINGYTKRMPKERHDWICTALGIDPEV